MTGENEYGVEIKFHHIISDAWSIVTVFNMIQEYYHKIENDFDIDDDELSYFDVFEKKQNKYIKSVKDIEDEKYWITMFNDFERPSSVKRRDYNVGIDAKLIAS